MFISSPKPWSSFESSRMGVSSVSLISTGEGAIESPRDSSRLKDGIGNGARDGTGDKTLTSKDKAHDKDADTDGEVDGQDEATRNPNLVSFI
jgi:hypothetical protein